MSFLNDRQTKRYFIFLLCFLSLFFILGTGFIERQSNEIQALLLAHDNAVVTSLLNQGVSKTMIASAISNVESSAAGADFLALVGRTQQTASGVLPMISLVSRTTGCLLFAAGLFLSVLLLTGTVLFLGKRERLYQQAADVLTGYIDGDYSRHMPQVCEGTVFQLFAAVDQLATMLRAQNEKEHRTKEFLKSTISDISHQLKTPLAALAMYQEIIAEEPDQPDTVKKFAQKAGVSLKRMEQLILSMLKITRLDAGSIIFEKESYQVAEVVCRAVGELTTRAESEKKEILMEGSSQERIVCDMEWTSEAVGNLVKNALDHMETGQAVRIIWENSSYMVRITVTDHGSGILPEDIHHIFKRFYRSKNSVDSQGVGLGLPLAKAIIEGQGGTISVRSNPKEGTVFTISMLTKM